MPPQASDWCVEEATLNLDLTETQSLLEETLRGFVEAEVPFDRVRELERSQGWDAELWQRLAGQGFLSLLADEGGADGGGSLIEVGLLVEQLARRAAIVPILEVVVAARAL
ncbi:MAG: acyl-CoA dehydrogenase family protein, partial [Myxococcota bacterium]